MMATEHQTAQLKTIIVYKTASPTRLMAWHNRFCFSRN